MKDINVDEIVATIPFGLEINPPDERIRFLVDSNGKLIEISIKTLNKGNLKERARIKNLIAGIRRYLFRIRSRYLKIEIKLDEIEISHPGQLDNIDKERERFNSIVQILQPKAKFESDELKKMYKQATWDILEIDQLLKHLKVKSVGISKWSLRLGTALVWEDQRIEQIINTTSRQLLNIYKNVRDKGLTKKIISHFTDSHCNLMNGLKTIRVNFSERPEDLQRLYRTIRMMERLPNYTLEDFEEKLLNIIEEMAILYTGNPIEIRVGNERYVISKGQLVQGRG